MIFNKLKIMNSYSNQVGLMLLAGVKHNQHVGVVSCITQCTYTFYLKIMTAVASQQSFPEMIEEIPPGHGKDLVLWLCG